MVNAINRRPISTEETEAIYQFHAPCAPEFVSIARDQLHIEFKRSRHPGRKNTILSNGEQAVELTAALVPTIALAGDLDAIITHLLDRIRR